MMGHAMVWVGVLLGIVILCGIIWALLKHPELPRIERIGLGLLGAGIVWGGINRAFERPVDTGDLLLLAGIVLVLWRYFKLHPKIEDVR